MQLDAKANLSGNTSQRFKVANAVNLNDAVTKIQLDAKADLGGNSSQRFKVADAVDPDDAINKAQLYAILVGGGFGGGNPGNGNPGGGSDVFDGIEVYGRYWAKQGFSIAYTPPTRSTTTGPSTTYTVTATVTHLATGETRTYTFNESSLVDGATIDPNGRTIIPMNTVPASECKLW